LPKPRLPAIVALALALAACAARIDSAWFTPSASVERAIQQHYARYASENDTCFSPFIDGFTNFTVLEDTPDRLVVDARYLFRDRVHSGQGDGANACIGFADRVFILERDPAGAPVVVGMTGDQDEPLIRSLIRRALPG
jgi:hypothetical protein